MSVVSPESNTRYMSRGMKLSELEEIFADELDVDDYVLVSDMKDTNGFDDPKSKKMKVIELLKFINKKWN